MRDALPDRIAELLADGFVPATRLSVRARRALASLFRVGVLVEERAGRGRRVIVRDAAALRGWAASRYPSGLTPDTGTLPPRAASVARTRHSKRGARLGSEPVFLRGFHGATLMGERETLPVADLTCAAGVAAVLVDDGCAWRVAGPLVVVENRELFLHIEHVVPEAQIALLADGRLSARVLRWLAAATDDRVIHAGDYDPVGVAEYVRLQNALGERTEFLVPDDLEERVQRFGRADLLAASAHLLPAVAARADAVARDVLDMLSRHGKALEQESLLIELE